MEATNDEISSWLDNRHFERLREINSKGCDWTGSRDPRIWAKNVDASLMVSRALPEDKHDRVTLKSFCADAGNSPEACFVAVMAWGGMKYGHGRSMWNLQDSWRDIITRLREGSLSRIESYELFRRFRSDNPGSGMGAAYFTKLIFFCRPNSDGYIMDQWTSLSVNLLFKSPDNPVVDMITTNYKRGRTDTVSDRNTSDNYETFCQCIEYLAVRLGVQKPEEVERWLFSQGGRTPAQWRQYVKEHRSLS